jgi:hypothetical protein
MRNFAFASLLPLTLAGCATAYQPNGYTGGFSETRYAVDIVQVTFEGNGYTSRERASDLSMLRSAELTLQNGYRYFIVMAGDVQSNAYSFTTPTRTVTTGTVQTYGNTASVNAQTQTYGGQTINGSKPAATKIIRMFKGQPESPMHYEAQFICDSIGTKYKITCAAAGDIKIIGDEK